MHGVNARGTYLCTMACLAELKRSAAAGRNPQVLISSHANTGNFYIDDMVLAAHGITDLEKYSVTPGSKHFIPDLFVD